MEVNLFSVMFCLINPDQHGAGQSACAERLTSKLPSVCVRVCLSGRVCAGDAEQRLGAAFLRDHRLEHGRRHRR